MAIAKKKPLNRRILRTFIGLALVLLLGSGGLIGAVHVGLFGKLPSTTELAALRTEEATLVLSQEGALIGKIFAKDRTNIAYKNLPQHLIDALVATEDQRFFEHRGVDTWSYIRVLVRNILGRDASAGGGSTISQQVIKNLYGRDRHGPLTLPVNKIKEAIVAQRLESVYTKQDVLTLYLNSVPFGENLYGVESAAQRFFSKNAAELAITESAVLVGMLKANTSYNPRLYPDRSRGRRDQVLQLMHGRGYLSQRVADSLRNTPLTLQYRGLKAWDAYGYVNARITSEAQGILDGLARNGKRYDIRKDGLRIHTTLDTALQRSAMDAAREQLSTIQPRLDRELRARKERGSWEKRVSKTHGRAWKTNARQVRDLFRWTTGSADTISYRDSLWHYHRMLHAAVLMMEPVSGKVRAWVGGNDHRVLPYDLVQARRPIASTIKPVIYAAALESGLTPCDYLDNTERDYPALDGWHPRNFDGTSGGEVAVWHALERSMNLPTVDLYFRTGSQAVRERFHALGLPTTSVEMPSAALGAADISLLEIVRAYGAFAAQGNTVAPKLIERITDASGTVIWLAARARPGSAMSGQTAAAITYMLQRAVDQGTGEALRSRYRLKSGIAGKTGTSQDYSDAWFIAYTPGLVIGTWVGAMDPSVHFSSADGTGSRLALPIVGSVLQDIERSRKMRERYLPPFDWLAQYEVDLDCPATRKGTAIGRIINELAPGKPKAPRPDAKRPEERKGFWRKLFPKKER